MSVQVGSGSEVSLASPPPVRLPLRVVRSLGTTFKNWGPGLPLLLLSFSALVAPIVGIALDSIRDDQGTFTLAAWEKVFSNKLDREAIFSSIKLSAACATVAAVVGVPLAWVVSRMRHRYRTAWLGLINVAANFAGIGLAFAFVATLGGSGMITILFDQIGLESLVPGRATFFGFLVTYSYFNVPLFVLLTLPAIGVLRDEWWESAQTASATRFQFWRYVGIPVLFPFVAAGWLLIFTWSIGQYSTAYALAGTGAGASFQLVTLTIGDVIKSSVFGLDRAAVLAVLLLAIAALALSLYRVVIRKGAQWL